MTVITPLLPPWLRLSWAFALCVVVSVHLWHAWAVSGSTRWWHASHIAMASSMAAMYLLPSMQYASLYRLGSAAFLIVATALAVMVVVSWRRDGLPHWLWVAAAWDMSVMAYMTLPVHDRPSALSYAVVAGLAAEMLTWLSNPLRPIMVLRPGVQVDRTPMAGDAPVAQLLIAVSEAELTRSIANVTPGVRVTLAVMAASMGWMLVAMQTMRMIIPVVSGH